MATIPNPPHNSGHPGAPHGPLYFAPQRSAETSAGSLWHATNEVFRGLLGDVAASLESRLAGPQQVRRALEELFRALCIRKLNSSATEWTTFVELCRQHPICRLVHQDPFTFRAYSKPRGYAGDAVMLDYIYAQEEGWEPPQATEVGRRIFDFTTRAPASEGVKARRGYVADLIDTFSTERRRPEILSLACGHLREVELTAAFKRGRLGRFVALDADRESLLEVDRCYSRFGIESVHSEARRLITGRLDLGRFDLIYTTGLFDYLDAGIGGRLVTRLFQMLRPGGELMVANFLPQIRDVGYMETFMDWKLVYRDRQQMIALTQHLAESEVESVRLHAEENLNIIFLRVRRR